MIYLSEEQGKAAIMIRIPNRGSVHKIEASFHSLSVRIGVVWAGEDADQQVYVMIAHNMEREQGIADYKGQKLLASITERP